MKRVIAVAILILVSMALKAQGGVNYDWAFKIGGTGNENIRDIQVSSSGFVYIGGGFQGTVDFDPGPGTTNLTAVGSNDMFFAKYTSTGDLVWVNKFGGNGDDYVFGIALGQNDSVVIAGYFGSTTAIDFDPGSGTALLGPASIVDGLVAKYDSAGNYGWANRIFGTSVDNVYDVVLDGDQNIYITGTHTSGTLTFSASPAISISSAGGNDAFLAKYDRNGVCQFANRIAGNGNDLGRSIAIDSNGDLFVAGQFTRTCDFDPSAGTANLVTPFSSDVNGFIAKYSDTGAYLWAESMGGTSTTGNDIAYAVETDASGNAWVCGQFYGIASFSPFSVTGTNNKNAFVAKYNTSGTCTFASGMAGTGSEAAAYAIDVDAADNVYVSGGFKGTIDFDLATGGSNIKTLTTNPTTANDAFMAKYTENGTYVWANKIGGTSSDESFAFRLIDNTSFFMAGYFQATADMDVRGTGQNLTSGGNNDAFLAKYSQCTLPPAPASISGIDTSCSSFLGQVFTAAPVAGATSYTWGLPAGWSGSSSTNSITVSSNMVGGTITVQANDACGTSLPVSKTVTMVFPVAQPASISGSTFVCSGAVETYTTPAVAGVSYQWTLPNGWTGTSTTNSIDVTVGSTTGTISVSAVGFCGPSTPRTVNAIVVAPPTGSISPAAPAICAGGSVTLTASGGNSYVWSNGLGSGASKTVSPTVTTTYSVTVTQTNNACSDVKSVTVTVNNAPTAAISPATVSICNGQTANLTASGGTGYAWSNSGGTNAAASFSPTSTTTYTVTVTDANTCTATASRLVTVNAIPNASISPATVAICSGASANLTASGGSSYTWSNSGGSNATASFSPTTTTTYNVTVSNGTCTATASRQVTVNALPTPSISPSTVGICAGQSATLTASGGNSYSWSNSLGNGASKTVSPTSSTTYTVTVTDANTCTATTSRLVTVNALPTASISPASATICSGSSQSLTASGGTSYVWSNGLGSGAIRSVSPLSATTYTVTVTNANNCTATASSTISVNPITVITTEPISQSTCTGSNVTFTVVASGVGLSYQWRKGASNVGTNSASLTIPSVVLSDAGNYSVIVSGTCGSDTSAAAALTVVTSASISQEPVAQTVCVGSPISLSVTGSGGNNTTYLWFKGATSLATQTSATLSIPSATASDAGNYYVVVSGSCGTINSDTVAITVNSLPTAAINPATTTICAGESQTLTASGGGTYTWSNSGGNNAAASFSPTSNTSYTVTVTNNGCSATATATVNVTPLPTPVITPLGPPIEICAGNSVTIMANGGGTYSWSGNGSTGSMITVSPTSTTTYTVTVTANGCSATASKQVTVNALPNISISPASASICPGSSQLLTASGASTYTWSNGLGTGSSKTVSPSSNTTYSVTATDANSCTATASATVTLGVSTTISTQPMAQTTCVGGNISFTVTAAGTGLSYNWRKDGVSLGAPNSATYNIASAVLADAGNYDVIVSGDCGVDTSSLAALTVTGSLQISQQPQPVIECAGSNAILTVVANGANISYTWTRNGNPVANSNNDTLFLNNLSAANTGSYVCNITSSCGNATSNAVLVTVNASTTGSISETICFGESFVFNNQTLSASGTYFDTLMNAAGCDSIVTLNFTVSPRIDTILNEVLCDGSSLTFNGQTISSAGQYLDTLVSATSCDSFITLNVSIALATSSSLTESACGSFSFGGESLVSTGTYFDTVMNAAGCDSVITLDLTILPNSSSNIADTICAGTNYNFGGQELTQTGIYTDTITDGLGCDSVISLALFVRPAFSVSVTQAGAVLVADAGFADYQWQLNGIDIANANSDTYTTTESGDYTVVVTDGNNCQATSELATITGVGFTNTNMAAYIKLYPNPAKDHLTIECSETIVGYEVQNLLGEVVLQSYSYSGPIDINELAASAYVIIVNTTKGTSISKFFKER